MEKSQVFEKELKELYSSVMLEYSTYNKCESDTRKIVLSAQKDLLEELAYNCDIKL